MFLYSEQSQYYCIITFVQVMLEVKIFCLLEKIHVNSTVIYVEMHFLAFSLIVYLIEVHLQHVCGFLYQELRHLYPL